MLKILSMILSLLAFFAAIWIIVPAPAYQIWLFSVAASEWSLWIGGFALLALICGTYAAIYGQGKLRFVWPILATAALISSLYPPLSVLKPARERNVTLSLSEYFSGFENGHKPDANFTTRTFASIDEKILQFDIYAPTAKNENNGAAVIVIHGGSWNGGHRGDFPPWNEWLAAAGFTVFDIDYRLAPQPNYLSATADVKCAVCFIKSHAGEFGIAPDRLALFGRSAGAHLALLAAYSADDPRLPPTCREMNASEKVRAVVSFYAPIEMLWAYDHPANQFVIDGPQTIGDFLGGDPHRSAQILERFTIATPSTYVSAATPPTLLVHGGRDQLVRPENMQFLDAKLNEAGVTHQTLLIDYAQHGFDYNFHGWGAQITKPVMLDFLRENTRSR